MSNLSVVEKPVIEPGQYDHFDDLVLALPPEIKNHPILQDIFFNEARNDGVIVNALAGIGGPLDKTQANQVARARVLHKLEQEELYLNWLVQVIVNLYPEDAARPGFEVTFRDEDHEKVAQINEDLKDYLENLGFIKKHVDGQKQARVYGGSAGILLVDDGQSADQPIDFKSIKKIYGIEVLDCHKITPYLNGFQDPGDPEYYQIVYSPQYRKLLREHFFNKVSKNAQTGSMRLSSTQLIHKSRIIRFDGIRTMPDMIEFGHLPGWGQSVIDSVWDSISCFDLVRTGIANMVSEYSVFVYSMEGFQAVLDSVNNKGDADESLKAMGKLRNYFREIKKMMSTIGGIIVDSKGKCEFITRNFAGLDQIKASYKEELIAASRIPHTVLFLESPSGLGATGESESNVWAMLVDTYREHFMRDDYRKMIKLAFLAKDGPTGGVEPKGWGIKFNSLYPETIEKQLESRLKQTQMDDIAIANGTLIKDEVRNSRHGNNEYSFNTTLDKELWEKKKQEEEQAKQQEQFGAFDFGGSAGGVAEEPPPEEGATKTDAVAIREDVLEAWKVDSERYPNVMAYQGAYLDTASEFEVYPSVWANLFFEKRYKELASHG